MKAPLLLVAVLTAGFVGAQGNLLPNGSFEWVEPPAPTAEQVKTSQTPPEESFIPRTWSPWSAWGGAWKCTTAPALAHTGNRAVQFLAKQGAAFVRYGPMPLPDRRPWTVSLWAKGSGKLAVTALDATTDQWKETVVQAFDVPPEWTELKVQYTPPEGQTKWLLGLATQGPTECVIDDVSLTAEGVTPPPWPPTAPLVKDEQTVLLLDFEEPFNEDAFYIGGKVSMADGERAGFGKCLSLGAEGYVACSADQSLDSRAGTIEVWVKLQNPGGNGVQQPFVSIPGMEGMWVGKDQYSHVGFSFSSGWAPLSHATAMGYAGYWQPCWRHVAACWDEDALQLFVDGKLIAWKVKPKLSRFLGPELRLGAPGVMLDNLRISKIVKYRTLLPPE